MKNNLNFGTLIEKDIIKYHFHGGTDFQKLVWSEIAKIPKGKILTYEQLALKINRPGSIRAVANACGKNPLPIIRPCHRVICSNGSLGGYSGPGGVKLKKALLRSESL